MTNMFGSCIKIFKIDIVRNDSEGSYLACNCSIKETFLKHAIIFARVWQMMYSLKGPGKHNLLNVCLFPQISSYLMVLEHTLCKRSCGMQFSLVTEQRSVQDLSVLSESGWTTPPFIFEMHELILLCTERREQHRYQNYTCIHQLSSLPQVSRLGPYVKHTSEHDLSDNILCLVMFIAIYLKNGKSVFRFGESMFYAVIGGKIL